MGGVKGRSGPPGNLNCSSHPWRTFWRRRALKPADKWILGMLEQYAGSLASDKPGATEAELRMIEIAQIARGASMLILAECARSGFTTQVDGTWDLSPGAKELARFLGVERASLQTLGLGRRAKPITDIAKQIQAAREARADGE